MSSKPLSIFRARFWGHEQQQPTWSVDASTATGLVLCIALLSLGGWLYLAQASQIATTSIRMRETVEKIEKIDRENALLRYQIAQLETIPRIEARARQLGLGPMYNQTTYLTISEQTAGLNAVPVVAQAAPIDLKAQFVVAKPEAHFAVPSVPDIWNDVKAQFESWMGE
jgi:hypothetical protein